MKIKWGLKIFEYSNCTQEELENRIVNSEPMIYFDRVKDCFEYLGFKIPRVGYGYVDIHYRKGKHIEYLLEPYRA